MKGYEIRQLAKKFVDSVDFEALRKDAQELIEEYKDCGEEIAEEGWVRIYIEDFYLGVFGQVRNDGDMDDVEQLENEIESLVPEGFAVELDGSDIFIAVDMGGESNAV